MPSTLCTVVFAALLLALPARAHARDAQRATSTRGEPPASPARDAQRATSTRGEPPAAPVRDAQRATSTRGEAPVRDAQRATSTRGEPPASPSRGVRGEVGANQLVAFGLPISPSIGISPFITFRWPDTSLSLEPRVLTAAPMPEVLTSLGSALRAWMSAVSACRHLRMFSLCGVFQLGRASLSERNPPIAADRNPLLVAFGARAGAGWRVSRYLSVHAALELNAHVGRPELWADPTTLVWRAPWGSTIIALGVTVPVTPE